MVIIFLSVQICFMAQAIVNNIKHDFHTKDNLAIKTGISTCIVDEI